MNRDEETESLIHELLDGTIAKEDVARLEKALLEDPEARQAYFALMSTDQMLLDNYEMPDHLAMHAQLMAGPLAEESSRVRSRWIWSSAALAALVMLAATLLVFLRREQPVATVAGSADSYFLIDGVTVNEGNWTKNQRLEVRDGVVVAKLNPHTEACIDGPALIYMSDNGRDLDLRRGRVFFRVDHGAPGFKIRAAGAQVRHIGTEFGVRVAEGGSCEVHVVSGKVEVDRGAQKGKWTLKAGESASWLNRGDTSLDPLDGTDFRKALPGETIVFEDDFNDPKGTRLNEKAPDIGMPWKVRSEKVATVVGEGKLDTSGGPRHLKGHFLADEEPNHRQVVLMSFRTRQPEWIWDKQSKMDGIEKIALEAEDGTILCSVQARASEGHRWRLRDEVGGRESPLTGFSALQENELTLRYDALGGKITLHSGTSTQAELVAEIPSSSFAAPKALVIWNDYGGDLALKRISVKVVDYP